MIASDNECTADDVLAIIKGDLPEPGNMQLPSDEQLKAAEWEVLSSVDVVNSLSKNFVARVEPDLHIYDRWGISKLVERVVLLDKLREVRAFCGYERVDTNGQIVPPAGQHESIKWLPAIEVFGEGIFLQLDQNEIKTLMEWLLLLCCMSMCVHADVCACPCIAVCMYSCVDVDVWLCACVHVCMCACVSMSMHCSVQVFLCLAVSPEAY